VTRSLGSLLFGLPLALTLFLPPARAQAPAPASAVQVLRQVQWTAVADPQSAIPDNAEWTRFELPLRWPVNEGEPLRTVALRMRFDLPEAPTVPWGVMFSELSDGGQVHVNGHFEGLIPSPDAGTHVRWWRPQMEAIDPADLRAGDNELTVLTPFRAGDHVLAGVEVGPLKTITAHFDRNYFTDRTCTWIGATVAAMVCLIFAAIWWRRSDGVAGMLALSSLSWVCYCTYFLVDVAPIGLRLPLECLRTASSGAFAALISISLLRLCGLRGLRWEWLILAFAALGPIALIGTAQAAAPYLDKVWLPGLVAIGAAVTLLGLYRSVQSLEAPPPVVLVAALVAIGAALADFGLIFGSSSLEGARAMTFAGPLLLLSMASPMVQRFLDVLRDAEAARAELETRVREREQLLKRNFERLRESERIKAEGQERQRIMQDMHDGLGSQLMSSLMLIERGAVTNEQVAQILRESIDDLRLAIDALAAEEADLGSALGNLRYRIEPRLKAAGIELAWDARNLPEEIGLHPDAVLPILRIVQEALNNALKHSGARVVRVTFDMTRTSGLEFLDIRVADNGRGMSAETPGGRGLLNMRNRAQRIGAQLNISSSPAAGTVVHLRCKLDPSHATNTREPRTALNTQAVIERVRQV